MQEVEVARDDRERVVQVVCEAARQHGQRLEPLGFVHLALLLELQAQGLQPRARLREFARLRGLGVEDAQSEDDAVVVPESGEPGFDQVVAERADQRLRAFEARAEDLVVEQLGDRRARGVRRASQALGDGATVARYVRAGELPEGAVVFDDLTTEREQRQRVGRSFDDGAQHRRLPP